MVKNLIASAGDSRDTDFIPGLGRSLGGGNGSPPAFSPRELHGQRNLAGFGP